MGFPNTALPVGHFQGLGNLSTNESDSLRNILNRVRAASTFGGYQVNPDDADKFATVNAAVTAAGLELPAGEPIVIKLAPGKTHALTGGAIIPPADRSLFIEPVVESRDVDQNEDGTIISGDFNLPDAGAAAARLQFKISGCIVNGDIAGNDNWHIHLHDMHIDGYMTRTHGTKGCKVTLDQITTDPMTFYLSDLDASPSQSNGRVTINDSKLNLAFNAGKAFNFSGPVQMAVYNSYLFMFVGAASSMIDMNSADVHVELSRCYIDVATMNILTLFANPQASSEVNLIQGTIIRQTVASGNDPIEATLALGTYTGGPTFYSTLAPTGAPTGSIWTDQELKDTLIWDGTYWGANGTYRKDVLVDIGAAALNHDVGFDLPATGAVISTSLKLLKALTGAGGAVQAGLGTGSAGDPDKYAETANLTIDQTDQNLHGTWNDGGGDDLQITAETAPGTSGGTITGSGDEDARVVVYFMLPKTLP